MRVRLLLLAAVLLVGLSTDPPASLQRHLYPQAQNPFAVSPRTTDLAQPQASSSADGSITRAVPAPASAQDSVKAARFQAGGLFGCGQLCALHEDNGSAGQVCGIGRATPSTCYRRCNPTVPDSCDAGWRCTLVTEDIGVPRRVPLHPPP